MFLRNKKSQHTVFTYGAPVLKKQAEPINEVTDEIHALAQKMLEAMMLFDGIGLAGPQIGVSKRIVTIDIPAGGMPQSPGEVMLFPRMPLVLINPEIVAFGKETGIQDEGCLSVPDLYGPVERPLTVTVKTDLISGEHIECECGGMLARCLQHEIDHLNGLLYVDRMSPDELARIKGKLDRIEKHGRKRNYQRKK